MSINKSGKRAFHILWGDWMFLFVVGGIMAIVAAVAITNSVAIDGSPLATKNGAFFLPMLFSFVSGFSISAASFCK